MDFIFCSFVICCVTWFLAVRRYTDFLLYEMVCYGFLLFFMNELDLAVLRSVICNVYKANHKRVTIRDLRMFLGHVRILHI